MDQRGQQQQEEVSHGAPRYRRWARGAIVAALVLAGCNGPASPPPTSEPGVFDRPQALIFAGPYLVVANTAYGANGWGDGSLVVLDPASGAVLNRVPTGAKNPQRLRTTGTTLYALETGPLVIGDEARATEDGALEAFPIVGLADMSSAKTHAPIVRSQDGRIGAPVDFVLTPDGPVAASGIAGVTWKVDETPTPEPYASPDALGLGSLARWREHTLLADFNSDRLHVLDDAGHSRCAFEIGTRPRDVEGAQSLTVHGDNAWFILSIAGTVGRVSLDELNVDAADCGAPPVETVVSPAGSVPNDLHVRDRIYVVDSGENRVVAYTFDGREDQDWQLPVGSNPWHLAFSPDGQHFAVTAWLANAVALFALDEAEPVWWVPLAPDAPSVDLGDRGDSRPASTVVEAPGAGEGPYSDPTRATNGVRGAGEFAGSTDVYEIPPGEHLVVGWGDQRIHDGPGPDLAVFENPFRYAGGVFMDPVVVEVSPDGQRWLAFPHAYVAPNPEMYSPDPTHWRGFAGVTPVRLSDPEADPFGVGAGGDVFDLRDLPDDTVRDTILEHGVAAVRLSAASDWVDPNTSEPYPADPASDGPDIDGVVGRYFERR